MELRRIGDIAKAFPALQETARRTQVCGIHGEFEQITFASGRVQGCLKCSQEEIRQAEEEKEAAQRRADRQMKLEVIEERIGDSGVPRRFRNKRIGDYRVETADQQKIVDSVSRYAKEFQQEGGHSGRCLAFVGNPGTGKTHLACALALHVINRCNGKARFTNVSEINRLMRESKSFQSAHTETEIITALAAYDLLIIDEVGVQSGTEAESRALFDVFNERYQNLKPTIVISNLSKEGLMSALGERISDRLREDGGEILGFNWESDRG